MELQGFINGCFVSFLFFLTDFSSCSPFNEELQVPFMTDDVQVVANKSFNYIIVGGGASGCSLAATLSEKFSVLLIERGGSPYNNLIEEKKNYGYPLIPSNTDEFTSIAQSFVSEEGVANFRGRVLGGSTAINGGFYSRASENYIRRTGWDRKLVKEAYEWVESRMIFRPNPLSPWQSVVRKGFIEAGIQPYNGFSWEHTNGTKVGGSIFDGHGRRHTSADLLLAGNLKMITVLLNATVKNVIFNHNSDGEKMTAIGVKFIKSHGHPDEVFEAYLNKANSSDSWGDVILSAGALSSPQILMLSGIGPQKHLNYFNITPLLDARKVGNGIKDNPLIAIFLNYSESLNEQPTDPPQVVGITYGYRIIVQSLVLPISSSSKVMTVVAKIANPLSKGELQLKSTDPRQNPSVRFNYFKKERDLDECVHMTRLIEKVIRTKSITQFVGKEQDRIVKQGNSSEIELRNFCQLNVRTVYHYHGGCQTGSVVDDEYRVFGAAGLRVIDGSTLRASPGTNPMATLLMLGRYQGIKMLREFNNSFNSHDSGAKDPAHHLN